MGEKKEVIVIGIDESEHSDYALGWALDHFFVPFAPHPPVLSEGEGKCEGEGEGEGEGKGEGKCEGSTTTTPMPSPCAPNYPFKLVLVHAKSTPTIAIGMAGAAGTMDVMPSVEADLKKIAARVTDKAIELCSSKSVTNLVVEEVEGHARDVLCHAVEKHQASILVVGSHGYGAIKRAVLGSVSDHCAHHANCSVMIVKRPKNKH